MTRSRTALLLTAALSAVTSLFAQSNTAKPVDASAQTTAPASRPTYPRVCSDCTERRRDPDAGTTRTFYLKYVISPSDMNEITAAVRQLTPEAKVFLVSTQSAIIVRAIPEDMALAERTINDLDRSKKTWRLTYTVTEVDGAKRLGAQHYSMVVADGQQADLKQGDRVPVATGSYAAKDASSHETVVSYQNVGMSFDATLNEIHEGARLRSDIAQTSLADDKAVAGAQDPVFRQSTLRSEAVLAPGKPLVLGSMDIPGSTRHLEIEVLMEPLP